MDWTPQKTVDLVHKAQAGDSSALDALIERYLPRIEKRVRSKMRRRNIGYLESSDVVQEVLLSTIQGIQTFEHKSERAFEKWVSKILVRQIQQDVRYFRTAKRDLSAEHPSGAPSQSRPDWSPPSPQQGPATKAEYQELVELATECKSRLTTRQKEILERRDLLEDWDSIATELNFPSIQAARTFHSKAKSALMNEIKKSHDRKT